MVAVLTAGNGGFGKFPKVGAGTCQPGCGFEVDVKLGMNPLSVGHINSDCDRMTIERFNFLHDLLQSVHPAGSQRYLRCRSRQYQGEMATQPPRCASNNRTPVGQIKRNLRFPP